MTQSVALLAAGATAVGIWFTDSFSLLVACWVLGTVLHGGVVLAEASPVVRGVVREVVLAEMFGSWVLLMAGMNLVLTAGAADLTSPELTASAGRDLAWTGVGLLLVVAARLGLPPVGPWPTRLAACPPAVRLFLQATVYPLSAHLLWWRLDLWLLPWHRTVAVGLGGLAALTALLAAAGERQPARRAALVSAAAWAGLLALTVHRSGPSWPALALTAVGALAVHLVAAIPRWPQVWRRVLSPRAEAATESQPTAWPAMAWLARQSRRPGPLPWVFELATRRLSALIASVDKVVLDGMVEGLALLSMGAGWLVAWCDRRGLDLLERGVSEVGLAAGRWSRSMVTAGPGRLVLVLGVVIMTLIVLGGGWR